MTFDVAVVGLGVMGSSAAYHLAKRGLRVLGLEQFGPAHDRGSSHGRTRIIRLAYWEHPDYVPLLRRAYELWRALEAETGRKLLVRTGGLMIGPSAGPFVRGSLESARRHGIPHRLLTLQELRREYPFMRFRDEDVALQDNDAGVLYAEESVLAFQERARAMGAELRFGQKAPALEDLPAPRAVIAAGSWMPEFLGDAPLEVERQVLFWFDEPPGPERVPLFMWDYEMRPFYTIPDVRGDGLKVAFHHGGERTSPENLRRDVGTEEVREMQDRLSRTLPGVGASLRRSAACLYTNTPDGHFAIGPMPGHPEWVVVSPCSGHGFKFAAVVGEIAADLVTKGQTRLPIGPFGVGRLFPGKAP
jgi:sarcosine oxidase